MPNIKATTATLTAFEGCSNFTRRLALAVSPRYEIYYCRDCDSVLFVDPDDTTRQDGGNIPGLGW